MGKGKGMGAGFIKLLLETEGTSTIMAYAVSSFSVGI
jgi:hypothetical protein